MNLMIVESPTKVKKLASYLGPEWVVLASAGHVCDLPNDRMGVAPPRYTPEYVTDPKKGGAISRMKREVSRAKAVYLATDPDREGEAIAYHLQRILGLKDALRCTFTEITKPAIEAAIAAPRRLDMGLVRAQEGRRVLDRLVGYTVSPVLSQQAAKPLSAGRVQSVAVKLVVAREQQIDTFTAQTYYALSLVTPAGLTAKLDIAPFSPAKHLLDAQVARMLAVEGDFIAGEPSVDLKRVNPRPPFTTSTLQQVALSQLNLSPKQTMQAAQALFEGGLITYHRTDTPNFSEEGFAAGASQLVSEGHEAADQRHKFRSKGGQEAHEAIRPTDFSVRQQGDTAEAQLYELIRERALSACMPAGEDEVTTVEYVSAQTFPGCEPDSFSHAKFVARGTVRRKAGWRSLPVIEAVGEGKDSLPAPDAPGSSFKATPMIKEAMTEPPKRFTQGTLVQALEKLGIGRPSTYADILAGIIKRSYINEGKGAKRKDCVLSPTPLGKDLVKALAGMEFMSLHYTQQVEAALDVIATSGEGYEVLVRDLHAGLVKALPSISMPCQVTLKPCPRCGKPLKQLAKGAGKQKRCFWVHIEDDPNCERFISDRDGEPFYEPPTIASCPRCGADVTRRERRDKSGFFWVHNDAAAAEGCQKFINDQDGAPAVPAQPAPA